MEEIPKRWQKLSLTDTEGDKLDLSKEKRIPEFVLAGKFFTRRAINIEAVAKTFRPLWRTRRNFEPWTYDRHLVALERYDGRKPVNELSFCSTAFWVQIHDLPFSLLTKEVALSIGATLGTVIKPADNSEVQGGNFVRVRVMVDTTKSLSRGPDCVLGQRQGRVGFFPL